MGKLIALALLRTRSAVKSGCWQRYLRSETSDRSRPGHTGRRRWRLVPVLLLPAEQQEDREPEDQHRAAARDLDHALDQNAVVPRRRVVGAAERDQLIDHRADLVV